MTQQEMVQVSIEDAVAVVTMNFPERRNAFGAPMREALSATFSRLMHATPEVRALVLTGANNTFCSGGDISEMKERGLLEHRSHMGLPVSIAKLMMTGPKPMVAAVQGHAIGAGLSLATACDYVVTTATARYCCAFIRMGLLPDTGILWSLAQKVGRNKARELMMLATEFDGTEAARLGVANEVVQADELLDAAKAVARRYASYPPVAMALLRSVLHEGCDSLTQALRTETDLQGPLSRTLDHKEAVSAFLEKRKPTFVGS